MLYLVFTTSQYHISYIFFIKHSTTPSPYNNSSRNNYFQFKQVDVTFVDIQSPTYVKSKRMCEFWLRGTGYGVLENPRHSLAPNTTCLYHLQVNLTHYLYKLCRFFFFAKKNNYRYIKS